MAILELLSRSPTTRRSPGWRCCTHFSKNCKLNAERTKFQIDLRTVQVFDHSCIWDDASSETIKGCYPLVTPRKSSSEKEKKSVTIAPPLALESRKLKTSRDGEYAKTFMLSISWWKMRTRTRARLSEIFRALLVADLLKPCCRRRATLEQALAKTRSS